MLVVSDLRAQNDIAITKEQAWEIVKDKVLSGDLSKINVSVLSTVVKANTEIEVLFKNEVAPDFDSWFFFIDDNPFESWEHQCRYVFVNAKTGDYKIENKKRPPLSSNMEELVEFKLPAIETISNDLHAIEESKADVQPAVNDYAVIISGGMNAKMNYQRYWNDCAAIYSTLINVYRYPKDHIYVLMSDGTDPGADMHLNSGSYMSSNPDLDGDHVADVQYSATKANISTVFNELSNKLTNKDNLFIFTTDHGGQDSGQSVYFCLWNDVMRDTEFANELNKVNARRINICMGQCNSGGFIDDLQGENRVIATACAYDESSYAMENLKYDEFVYYWISAVRDIVDADITDDGKVSMSEAFNYAKKRDTRNETPQYSATPSYVGAGLFMAQTIENKNLSIVGDAFNCDAEGTYYVNNLQDGMTVVWDKANCYGSFSLSQDDPLENQCTVNHGRNYCDFDLIAHVYNNGTYFATIVKHVYGKVVPLLGYYRQEACNYYGVNHPEIKQKSIENGKAIFFHMGCLGEIVSEHFKGMSISRSGTEPEYFNYDRNKTIELKFPLNSGGVPMHITGTCENSRANFDLLIFAVTANGNIQNTFSITPSDCGYEIVLTDNDNSNGFTRASLTAGEEWDVNVYDLMSSSKIFSAHVVGNKYRIDTTNWHKGTYVLQVVKNSDVTAKKIYIK